MRLKEYTHEEIKNNIDQIRYIEISYKNELMVKKPEIIKVTEKQFKTGNLGNRTVRFADVGYFAWRHGFILEKDIDYAIGVYQRAVIDKANRKIEEAKREIESVNQLKRVGTP